MASIRRGLEVWGKPLPGIRLRCRNAIPHSRGLGSSAAAIVGGLAIGWAIAFGDRPVDRDELFRLATAVESHPDNAGAAVYGGALLGWQETESPQMVPIQLDPKISFRVFVPDYKANTSKARQLLPDQVPRKAAVKQLSRAALLMYSLTSGEQLFAATEDWLHQQYRAEIMMPSWELMSKLRADRLPAVISGAGPTVLLMGSADQLEKADEPVGFRVLDLPVGDGVSLQVN